MAVQAKEAVNNSIVEENIDTLDFIRKERKAAFERYERSFKTASIIEEFKPKILESQEGQPNDEIENTFY